MRRTMTKLMALAITCVALTGCDELASQIAGMAALDGQSQSDLYKSIVAIGTWPTPERPSSVAIGTWPTPRPVRLGGGSSFLPRRPGLVAIDTVPLPE